MGGGGRGGVQGYMYAKFIIIQPGRPISMDSSPMADNEDVW